MGYESKFFAVREYQFPKDGLHHSDVIATLDMCKMGNEDEIMDFRNLFDTETPFTIRMFEYNPETEEEEMMEVHEDKYGETLKYITDKRKGIELIKNVMNKNDYWRFKLLLEFMRMFADYNDVYIVHYGY